MKAACKQSLQLQHLAQPLQRVRVFTAPRNQLLNRTEWHSAVDERECGLPRLSILHFKQTLRPNLLRCV
jgi:hypothetical protein